MTIGHLLERYSFVEYVSIYEESWIDDPGDNDNINYITRKKFSGTVFSLKDHKSLLGKTFTKVRFPDVRLRPHEISIYYLKDENVSQ